MPILDALPRTPLLLALSVAAFLLAAKSHGRQVRLERERAGHYEVVFGGTNPPFVEALWRRDRIRFWTTAALVFAAIAALLGLRASGVTPPFGGGRGGVAWMLLFLPMVTGFFVCGVASLVGFVATRAMDPEFTSATLTGSLGWWSAATTALIATGLLAFRPPD